MGLTGTILYLVAAPLLGIAATFLAKTGAARLFGYEQPSLRDMLSDLAEGIRQSPLPGERPPLYGTIVYLVGAAIAGAVFWYGSSLFVAALIWFIAAMAIPVSLCAQPSSGLWFQSPREATEGVVREILWIAALFFQSALLAIGLFLVSVFGIGAGSFLVSDAFAMGGAPVYYLPGCFIGIAIVLALYPRKEVEHWTLAADATGRSLLFLQLGRHYEQTLFYSIVYQGIGRRLGTQVRTVNEIAVAGIEPDLTFLLLVDPIEGKRRISDGPLDRLEQEGMEYYQAVYDGYLQLAKEHPSRIIVIDGTKTIEEIQEEIRHCTDRFVSGNERRL